MKVAICVLGHLFLFTWGTLLRGDESWVSSVVVPIAEDEEHRHSRPLLSRSSIIFVEFILFR